MKTKTEFQPKIFDTDFEKQIKSYYSSHKADPSFKRTLHDQLCLEISQNPAGKQRNPAFHGIFSHPKVQWGIGIFAFVILCILSLVIIAPVREAIGKAIDLGYLEGVGFVRMSETYVLNGTVISERLSQVVVIDQVVVDSEGTTIWLHATGEQLLAQSTSGEPVAYLEAAGQQYPTSAWGWVDDTQNGVLRFSASTPAMPPAFFLHITPDWNIPIQLTLMSENTDGQAVTLFSDQCQVNNGVELCVTAFVNDSNGYHLLLNAFSSNPDFYLESLYLNNPLTGRDVQLMDSSGKLLQKSSVSSTNFSLPFEIPVEVFDAQREASTTLHFFPSSKDNHSLTLTASGLDVKTPVNQIITCDVGDNPAIGSTFPCETSITIGGIELTFHSVEVVQGQTGIQLRIISDPIQPRDNLLVTGLYFENLNGVDSATGTSFEVKTRQLILFLEQKAFSSGQSFHIKIVDGYLTILEPYQFTWTINP
jgi:hypothetical protein